MTRFSARRTGLALTLLVALPFTGCGGGSSSSELAFTFESISIAPGEQDVRLNRPIEVRFNRALDFDTVSTSTFQVVAAPGETIPDPDQPETTLAVGGLPALGDYRLEDPRTVSFRPRCPDAEGQAGLLPGVRYQVRLPGASEGVALAAAADGSVLLTGVAVEFRTSDSSDAAQRYFDPLPGPAKPVVRAAGSRLATATRLELGGDASRPVYFEVPADGGVATPQGDVAVPLNLYSEPRSSVHVLLALDQPVNPSPENVSSNRVRLEFRGARGVRTWSRFSSDVSLEENCNAGGALLRIVPRGPLPQGRALRVVIEPDFEDLVGERNPAALAQFVRFDVGVATDPGTRIAGDAADEVRITFDGASVAREDDAALLGAPRAAWGPDGALSAVIGFEGDGGPGGDFDLVLPPEQDTIFDTVSSTFFGGPGGVASRTLVATDGVLNVRDLTIPAGSVLRIQGPNPCRILASGAVRIDGSIVCNGANAESLPVPGVPTFLPVPGAPGVAGGGAGGVGSPNPTALSERAGAGFGGIDQLPGGGGQGGESAFSADEANFGEARRAAGGGGGVFGADTRLADGCGDETYIGLNVEPGHPGAAPAFGMATLMSPPSGGAAGAGPFSDGDPTNDFFGTLLLDPDGDAPSLVEGELREPWAGAGGGGGGDSARIEPNGDLDPQSIRRGAGGGGGAGSLSILALGEIRFGIDGRVEAVGGNGAGGENTNFVNRIGGGSGGGSGGHVILQSATRIDFSEKVPVAVACGVGTPLDRDLGCLAIAALGGQGGAGAGNLGGYDLEGPDANDAPNDDAPVIDPALACPAQERPATGGDGGPGLVQLHAPTLADIVPPRDGSIADLASLIRPAPVGFDEVTSAWTGQLRLSIGGLSRARSEWISLGGMHVAPGSETLEAIEFLFDGIDPATGRVRTTAETVDELPALLSETLRSPGQLPYVDADRATVVFDVTELRGADDHYRRNPNLLTLFLLRVGGREFEIASAVSDEVAGTLALSVAGFEPLAGVFEGDPIEVVPRFFAISTEGTPDFLPDSAAVTFRFQAAPADDLGRPDEDAATAPVSDVSELTNAVRNTEFRFFRFLVEFDVAADGAPLEPATPLPNVELLRMPFRF